MTVGKTDELTAEQQVEHRRAVRREYQRRYVAKYPNRVRETARKSRKKNPDAARAAPGARPKECSLVAGNKTPCRCNCHRRSV